MKASSAKAKGRRFQEWVAGRISQITGLSIGKDKEVASREMGQHGVDIRLVGKRARSRFPFAVECKNQERWDLGKWVAQARANVPHVWARGWLLFIKKNRFDPFVVMDADEFFRIWDEYLVFRRSHRELKQIKGEDNE